MMKKTVEILSILTMILAMGGCESSSPSDVPVARNDTFNVREDTTLKDGDVTLNDTWSQAGGNTWYVQRDVKHGKLILREC